MSAVVAVVVGPGAEIEDREPAGLRHQHMPAVRGGIQSQEAFERDVAGWFECLGVEHQHPAVIAQGQPRGARGLFHRSGVLGGAGTPGDDSRQEQNGEEFEHAAQPSR